MAAVAADSVVSPTTLEPLPPVLKQGLVAVSFFGLLSFISSCSLLVYLTYKLVIWRIRGQAFRGYNQFLLLIYNLVLTDVQQSAAFTLAIQWLVQNKIQVDTSICWAQGWLVSTGDLASGAWIFFIAVHTFFAVVKGRKLPYPIFILTIFLVWGFVYAMAIAGVASNHKHPFYARAGAWCWIDDTFERERLWLHYFWIFCFMFGTILVYSTIYLALRGEMRSHIMLSSNSLSPLSHGAVDTRDFNRASRYMIIYPVIYVVCTLPLAAGCMASMTGRTMPYWYYCSAGSAITSCGWLDVILYAFTRRVLIFSDKPPPVDELGLDTFAAFRSPQEFYMRTVIEGGVLVDPTISTRRRHRREEQLLGDNRSGSGAGIDETFDLAVPDAITTKRTIRMTSEPRYLKRQSIIDGLSIKK